MSSIKLKSQVESVLLLPEDAQINTFMPKGIVRQMTGLMIYDRLLSIESSNLHLNKAQLKKYQVLDQTPLEMEDLSPEVNNLPCLRYHMLLIVSFHFSLPVVLFPAKPSAHRIFCP